MDKGTPPIPIIDQRADYHGRVRDFVSGHDRAWFEAHPGVAVYHRPAFDCEFCHPREMPACVPICAPPPSRPGVRWVIWVEVEKVAPWFRFRQPYWVAVPDGEAAQ